MIDLKDKKVLIYDHNQFLEIAVRLAKDFGSVFYFSNWQIDFPSAASKSIGRGLEDEGVVRVDNFWDYVDKVDLIVFPDVGDADLVDYLRNKGYRVWGSGKGAELESDRVSAKEFMKHLKMPVNNYEVIIGLDSLRDYLKEEKNEDKYIKTDIRGDFESFHHEKYRLTEPFLDSLENSLGAAKFDYEFVVEDPIDAVVEYGFDGYCIDGQYPKTTLFGVECKDLGYVGTVKEYKDISELVTMPNEKFAPFLKKKKYRNFMSTEVRITKDKKSYMIDFTARIPSPPGDIYQEIIENYSEIIWFGADGIMVDPIYTHKYAIQAVIKSSWAAGDGWQAIYFPEELRRWIKIKNLFKHDDIYYFVPAFGGYEEIGSVVAIGNTLDECVELLKERSEKIEGYKINVPVGSIDKAMESIEAGKSLGIQF